MKRLAYYIVENGFQISGEKKFLISKSEVGKGKKDTAYIEFDGDNFEFNILLLTEMSFGGLSGQTFITMALGDIENTQKTVVVTLKTNATTYIATGTIFADSFDADNNYVYDFECNNSDMSSPMKTLLETGISRMLYLCGCMLKETKTGVTLYGLGFKNF